MLSNYSDPLFLLFSNMGVFFVIYGHNMIPLNFRISG